MIGTDETNFPYNLSLTGRQVASFYKSFANIKSSRTQLSKIIQSDGFLGRLLGPLMKVGLSLMKNVLTPSAKNVLIPLGLTALAIDSGIHKKY